MKNKIGLWFLVLIVVLFAAIYVFCRNDIKILVSKSQVQKKINKEENIVLDINSIDDAYQAILNNSTKEFIGYHEVSDNFLGWFTKLYGEETLQNIASECLNHNADVWYEKTGKSIQVLWLEYCREIGLQSYQLNNVYDKTCNQSDEVVIDFAGDVTLADNVATTNYMIQQPNGFEDCLSESLLKEMQQADLMVINNEFTFTTRGTPLKGKAYTFRANPQMISQYDALGIDLVTLANNHVWDYGEIGLLDTFSTLQEHHLPYTGAGNNLDEASTPVYFVANGRKIAICNATQIERSYHYTKEATEKTPGVLKTLKSDKFVKEIEIAKKNSDIVIVVVHWGTEGNVSYGADQKKLAEDYVKAGADVIIGGHTHCLQGMEYIDDVPVYYSLGNFYFSTTEAMLADYDTGMAQVVIDKNGNINVKFIPCQFSNGVLSLVEDEANKTQLYTKLEELSPNVIIDKDGSLSQKK